MHASTTKRSVKSGLPPGTPVHVGVRRTDRVILSLMDYDEAGLTERRDTSIEECLALLDTPSVTWMNVAGLAGLETIESIGRHLGLHPLLVEDLVNTTQRPKIDDYGDHLFIVLKMLTYDVPSQSIEVEQVSLVLGANYLMSFQEDENDLFDGVRQRIRGGAGRMRQAGADYLTYAMIDAVVDHYFVILEHLGDEIEDVEAELVDHPAPDTLQSIYRLKRQMIALRRSVWPLREVAAFLERGESPLIQDGTRVYLRDIYDHTVQIIETIEAMRDLLASMVDIYLSAISNRTNEIVKVLTVFGTIFIPLTFLAGVYGMNFRYMPELGWQFGYPLFWLFAIGVIVIMLAYFKRRRWL